MYRIFDLWILQKILIFESFNNDNYVLVYVTMTPLDIKASKNISSAAWLY